MGLRKEWKKNNSVRDFSAVTMTWTIFDEMSPIVDMTLTGVRVV